MTRKPRMSDWPHILYRLEVKYYATGCLSHGETKVYDYYKADSITPEQREKITNIQSDIRFMTSACEYAPEITSGLICIPKAGYYKLANKGLNQ